MLRFTECPREQAIFPPLSPSSRALQPHDPPCLSPRQESVPTTPGIAPWSTSGSNVRVILDISPMKRIYFDAERRAVAIEAVATAGEAFQALSERWGTVVPLGEYPGIGIGGHVAGGAFGFLCRQLGLAADHLHAVEVVTVDESKGPCTVVATCEPSDPNRELWWAHTGGGGGNFGIVTRYWFRSPDASGSEPDRLLPRARSRSRPSPPSGAGPTSTSDRFTDWW